MRAIYILQENECDTGVTSIADRLGLSKSTVSQRVKELVRDGWAEAKPYEAVSLTAKGYKVGAKMTYKHRLIEVFLNKTLQVPKEKVHQEAESLEHAFSDDVIMRLAKFLGNPTCDPHGSPIPKIKDWK